MVTKGPYPRSWRQIVQRATFTILPSAVACVIAAWITNLTWFDVWMVAWFTLAIVSSVVYFVEFRQAPPPTRTSMIREGHISSFAWIVTVNALLPIFLKAVFLCEEYSYPEAELAVILGAFLCLALALVATYFYHRRRGILPGSEAASTAE
jgi:cobalamin synthase